MSASLQEILELELPIIQAPMAGVQDSALAIAVSNASGCREIPAAQLTRELAQSL
jgi:nitronate monooxygenase